MYICSRLLSIFVCSWMHVHLLTISLYPSLLVHECMYICLRRLSSPFLFVHECMYIYLFTTSAGEQDRKIHRNQMLRCTMEISRRLYRYLDAFDTNHSNTVLWCSYAIPHTDIHRSSYRNSTSCILCCRPCNVCEIGWPLIGFWNVPPMIQSATARTSHSRVNTFALVLLGNTITVHFCVCVSRLRVLSLRLRYYGLSIYAEKINYYHTQSYPRSCLFYYAFVLTHRYEFHHRSGNSRHRLLWTKSRKYSTIAPSKAIR